MQKVNTIITTRSTMGNTYKGVRLSHEMYKKHMVQHINHGQLYFEHEYHTNLCAVDNSESCEELVGSLTTSIDDRVFS